MRSSGGKVFLRLPFAWVLRRTVTEAERVRQREEERVGQVVQGLVVLGRTGLLA